MCFGTHQEITIGYHFYRGTQIKMTPLHCAAVNGQKAACLALVEAGANVDAKDIVRRTHCHECVR